MENRDIFLHAGGSSYGYIPCLNQDSRHIEALAELVLQHTQGWSALRTEDELGLELSARKARALDMGAET